MNQTTIQAVFPTVRILEQEPLQYYTYTKIGGNADWLIFPKSIQEVKDVVCYLKQENIPLTILGNASNVLITDEGIRGAVLMLTDMKHIEVTETNVTALAGDLLAEVTAVAKNHSLTGVEFACGIPGSVGGAVYMNAGAYGGEVADVIETVTVLTTMGEIKTYHNNDMKFAYRYSIIQETNDIVLSVSFALEKGQQEKIAEKMADLTLQRESKQPLEYPSCGSVFKRPEGHFTGKLIQAAGLQGLRIGGAEVSKKHAGFIVNIDGATARDYMDVIHKVQEVVWDTYRVRLEREVRIIGENSENE